MSITLSKLAEGKNKMSRAKLLSLHPSKDYSDGRTKQCFKDECDIVKIMARAEIAGTTKHLEKFEGVYADFSDFDFFSQTQKLTRGREIFDELPAEVRREFDQSPQKFFDYVNNPANAGKLTALAKPGDQRIPVKLQTADEEKARSAAQPSVDLKPQTDTPTPPAPAVDP